MRLHPAVTRDEVLKWLSEEAERLAPGAPRSELESALSEFAQSMAAVSAIVLPDTLEPRFP